MILKTIAKAYKILLSSTKELIESNSIPTQNFEKLCDVAGIELGPHTLNYITFVESIGGIYIIKLFSSRNF